MKKLKFPLLLALQHCLRHIMLPAKGHGLDYEIIKNLAAIDKKVREIDGLIAALKEKYYTKDETGNNILFWLDKIDDRTGQFKKDDQGNFIKFKNQLTGKGEPMIENTVYFNKALDALMNDEHEVKLHEFATEKVIKAFNDGALQGLDIVVLVDILIVDKEE